MLPFMMGGFSFELTTISCSILFIINRYTFDIGLVHLNIKEKKLNCINNFN
jgi:hypothetical protein